MATINKKETSLVIMDFQNDLVDPKGSFGSGGLAERVVEKNAIENTSAAVSAARKGDVPVFFVRVAFRKGHPEVSGNAPLLVAIKQGVALLDGSWGANFHPALQPKDDEIVITKRGISAFAGTDLRLICQNRGITTLVLAGIVTNFVVEGTARDAVDVGLNVVILSDCCTSFTEEMHDFSLQILRQLATVISVDEFLEAIS